MGNGAHQLVELAAELPDGLAGGHGSAVETAGIGTGEAECCYGVCEADIDRFEPASSLGALGFQIACLSETRGDLGERLHVIRLGERVKLRAEGIQ